MVAMKVGSMNKSDGILYFKTWEHLDFSLKCTYELGVAHGVSLISFDGGIGNVYIQYVIHRNNTHWMQDRFKQNWIWIREDSHVVTRHKYESIVIHNLFLFVYIHPKMATTKR